MFSALFEFNKGFSFLYGFFYHDDSGEYHYAKRVRI